MKLIIFLVLQSLFFIFAKPCLKSQNSSISPVCSENDSIITNLTYYLFNFSNITHLSLTNSYLTEMPDLYNNNQIISLDLDNNQIQSLNRNYSTTEYLYLASNHITSLFQTNLYYPKLILLDLSYNHIEYIAENFFCDKQFPQLKILKLINALVHVNLYLTYQRLISFSSLIYLDEIYMDENNFQEFFCSKTNKNIQWVLPNNLKKISLRQNKLISLDETCLTQIINLTELDLHSNYLKSFSNLNFSLPYLSKLQLDSNQFNIVPSNFLYLSQQLTELDLSGNHLNLQTIQSKDHFVFPTTLKILYLNSVSSDLSCFLFENLLELEQLHLTALISTRLQYCIFKNLINLKTVHNNFLYVSNPRCNVHKLIFFYSLIYMVTI